MYVFEVIHYLPPFEICIRTVLNKRVHCCYSQPESVHNTSIQQDPKHGFKLDCI